MEFEKIKTNLVELRKRVESIIDKRFDGEEIEEATFNLISVIAKYVLGVGNLSDDKELMNIVASLLDSVREVSEGLDEDSAGFFMDQFICHVDIARCDLENKVKGIIIEAYDDLKCLEGYIGYMCKDYESPKIMIPIDGKIHVIWGYNCWWVHQPETNNLAVGKKVEDDFLKVAKSNKNNLMVAMTEFIDEVTEEK